jgi:hypothetical protein
MRGYGSGSGGSGVIFSNVNVEDPRPTMQTFFECMTVPAPNGSASRTSGDWAGTVFKNVSIAATNHNYQPEILWGNTNAQIHDLTFDNFSIAGQKVLSNPFTTNAYVYNLWFTNSDTTAPLVSGAPASGSFAAPFTINLGVDENYGYYSTNGISWHQFSPITGAAIYVGDTTSLSVIHLFAAFTRFSDSNHPGLLQCGDGHWREYQLNRWQCHGHIRGAGQHQLGGCERMAFPLHECGTFYVYRQQRDQFVSTTILSRDAAVSTLVAAVLFFDRQTEPPHARLLCFDCQNVGALRRKPFGKGRGNACFF